ncbi:hypothetical protein Q5752_000371 [Cryptotrichosporon argae]
MKHADETELGSGHLDKAARARPHPQTTYAETTIVPDSFYGSLRTLFADRVLKTQLDQLRKQGSYDAFRLGWCPTYDVRRLTGAKTRLDGIPPSLFWESDVGKWIEAACYFLSTHTASAHAAEFEAAIAELVDMIAAAQQDDGYLNIYFTVVDPAGRFKNMRDMHEMYNAGHLLEGALAHYHYTGSRKFIDVMIKNVDCFMRHVGPDEGQLHGYPGHPELELALLRLYAVTRDPRHERFALYLLEERGTRRPEQGKDGRYFVHEAEVRDDHVHPLTMESLKDVSYHQAHAPLTEQQDILGHSVRAFYLLTGAADAGGPLLDAARRLWTDAVDAKMYVTGGFGTEPRIEGFSRIAHRLPQSTGEGGCYAETCASIAAIMCSERILSHALDGKVRDTMELALLNAVLGGTNLEGTAFSYANKLATYGDETAERAEWFEVCCCPPNLSRTLGMLGGYTWATRVDAAAKTIGLDVYLLLSAARTVELGGGATATVKMSSGMPWAGGAGLELSAPDGWSWDLRLPKPGYATGVTLSVPATERDGFLHARLPATAAVELAFDMAVRLLAPHPASGQDTLTVTRGPIVYVAESVDNAALDDAHPHFEGLGISPRAQFAQRTTQIAGVDVVLLQSAAGDVLELDNWDGPAYRENQGRTWTKRPEEVTWVPWFARANRSGKGRVRTSFLRADE